MKPEPKEYTYILKLDHEMKKVSVSKMSIEERLETIPALIYDKDLNMYTLSTRLSETKRLIKNMETEEFNRYRKMTQPGVKEGTLKPKYTVELAQFEATKQLSMTDKGYKRLKTQEFDLHEDMEKLKNEKYFLDNMFKAARTLGWMKVGKEVMEAMG